MLGGIISQRMNPWLWWSTELKPQVWAQWTIATLTIKQNTCTKAKNHVPYKSSNSLWPPHFHYSFRLPSQLEKTIVVWHIKYLQIKLVFYPKNNYISTLLTEHSPLHPSKGTPTFDNVHGKPFVVYIPQLHVLLVSTEKPEIDCVIAIKRYGNGGSSLVESRLQSSRNKQLSHLYQKRNEIESRSIVAKHCKLNQNSFTQ